MSKPSIRLYTEEALSNNEVIDLSKEQAHYLANVMRRKEGSDVLLFNGKDGEWLGEITSISKKNCQLQITEQTREQKPEPDIWLCFAPVKNAPINNLTQKATELGVSVLQPVITERTIVNRVNTDRLRANAMESSEQSERLTVPVVNEEMKLKHLLENWDESREIILCDESGGGKPFLTAMKGRAKGKYAILIGPEGGFSQTEFEILRNKPYITAVGMGPRILRADTAAISALTCYQAILGDWDESPDFKQEN